MAREVRVAKYMCVATRKVLYYFGTYDFSQCHEKDRHILINLGYSS
jgi:hypothetical protein